MTLSLESVRCPACFEILIEPVTAPCKHSVCKVCLEYTFENNKYNCVVCRKFLGSWVRSAKSKNSYIDVNLWNNINQQFGSLVDKRLKNEDYEMPVDNVPRIVSTPGKVGKEFQETAIKIQTEFEALQEEYNKRSRSFIEKMQKEEEERLKLIEEDEQIARSLEAVERESLKSIPELNLSSAVSSNLSLTSLKIRSTNQNSKNSKSSGANVKNIINSNVLRKRRRSLFANRGGKSVNVLDAYFKRNSSAVVTNNSDITVNNAVVPTTNVPSNAIIANYDAVPSTSGSGSSSSSNSSCRQSSSRSLSDVEINEIYRALCNDDCEYDLVHSNNKNNNDADEYINEKKCKTISELIKIEEEFLKNKQIANMDYELTKNLQKSDNNLAILRNVNRKSYVNRHVTTTSPRNIQTLDKLLLIGKRPQ